MVDTVLVFGAHPDDQIFGAGGTVAKYAQQGTKIVTVIFSYGESSHPWFKSKFTIKMRVEETLKADKLIGAKETVFFGLTEGNFQKEAKEHHLHKKIKELIKKYKPIKIFTHTTADPHPDHKSTKRLVLKAFDSMRFHCDVYTFDVWNPLNIKRTSAPKLIVDISDTFKTKIKALKCFKSQKMSMLSLMWGVYFKAMNFGLKHNCKYAEVFYKIR